MRMGILGVEPRLSPYKEPALTIKLYPQIIKVRRYSIQYVFELHPELFHHRES
jgi:hypothetical protein